MKTLYVEASELRFLLDPKGGAYRSGSIRNYLLTDRDVGIIVPDDWEDKLPDVEKRA